MGFASARPNEIMHLIVDRQYILEPDSILEIDVIQFQQLHNCPLGFIFGNICACDYVLVKQGIHCNTTSLTVIRNAQK